MRHLTAAVLAVAMMASATFVSAEELKSGLQANQSIGAFFVTKSAGADKDGVKVGKNLCYRCKNGQRPQVMVFTRSSDKNVAKLVSQLDAAVEKNSDQQLRAFVNYMGKSKASASKDAKKLCATTKAKNLPFVVPNEYENGPGNYGLSPKAEITIILAQGGRVKANHAFASAKDVKVDAVIKDLKKILK
jgi:hypothetical protein